MNLDNLTLGEIKQLKKLLSCESEQRSHNGEQVRIVILQRGWVVIGRYYQSGTRCWLENGYVIRRWGTSEGLPELAIKGKLIDTILDASPTIEFHELNIVASIICDKTKWVDILKD